MWFRHVRRVLGCLTAVAGVAVCAAAAPSLAAAPVKTGKPGGVILHHKKSGSPFVGSFIQNQRPSLQYFGGPVLRTNETFAIFWDPAGGMSQSYRDLVVRYLRDVAADSGSTANVYSVLNQYSDTTGPIAYDSTFAGSAVDTNPFPSGCPATQRFPVCITDQQLATELDSFLFAHNIARPANRVFMVLTPAGVNTCFNPGGFGCLASSFCAYHSGFSGGHGETLYANLPFQDIPECDFGFHPNGNSADATINSMSHEHREVIDDPLVFKATDFGPPLAWVDPFTGEESSDKCTPWFGPAKSNGVGLYNQVINGHQYLLQTDWSNSLAQAQGLGCVGDGVDRAPSAAFTSRNTGANVTFDGSASSDPDSGDAVSNYIWLFGDGMVGFGPRPKHRYASAGTYAVRLEVVDGHGAAAFVDKDVTVKAPTPAPTHPFQVNLTENLNAVTFHTRGAGSATGMGKVTLDDFVFFDFTNFPVSLDVFEFFNTLRTAKGDRLIYSYQATMTDVTNPPEGNNYEMSGTFVVEGGTGAFANATGSGTISGTCTSSFARDDADCTERWDGTVGGF